MKFRDIFQVFSRRPDAADAPSMPLTDRFRNRVLMHCRDSLGPSGYLDAFWEQIHSRLTYLHGSPQLTDQRHASTVDDVLAFLMSCPDKHFLDFVEFIFRVDAFFHAHGRESFVEDVNEFFRVDDLPYAVTDFVWTKGIVTEFGRQYESTSLSEYPRVICRESDFLHVSAIEPALSILAGAKYSAANAEFLEALEDYRQGDFGDCLTKCGSAFESVMKVMCHERNWPHRQEDTAATLLRTVIGRTELDPFMEQPLIVIATLRNRLSKSHGAGTKERQVSRELAQYAINATAAAVLLLAQTPK